MQDIKEKNKVMKLLKKMIIAIIVLLLFNSTVFAYSENEKIQVKLVEPIDGDTAKVEYDGEVVTLRFLAVDTPETKYSKWGEEPYGSEASAFTKKTLNEAEKLEIEFDKNSDRQDNYDRYLVWLWVDDVLMQELLIKNGLGEVAYLYGDYKYTETLETLQEKAKKDSIGMWGGNKLEENTTKEDENNQENITNKNEESLIELGQNINPNHSCIYVEEDTEPTGDNYATILMGIIVVVLFVIKGVVTNKKK